MKMLVNEAIESLKLLKSQTKPGDFDRLFDEIEKIIARCPTCFGRGKVYKGTKHGGGYKILRTPMRDEVFVYPCSSCGGTGQKKEAVACSSCGLACYMEAFGFGGVNTEDVWIPDMTQLCEVCREKKEKSFGFIAEVPKAPEPPKPPSQKIEEAQKEAKKEEKKPIDKPGRRGR